jgi:myo-inositol-1(or 4)-monophosphatase
MYYAVKGQGAFLGDMKLELDPMLPLSKAIVTFGDFSKSNPSSRGFQLKAIAAMVESAMRVRIQGASSVDFAFVASGKNGCHIIFSKNIWELAPGTMLAVEAGCKVYRLSGDRHGFSGEGLIIAGNIAILNEVVALLEQLQ